MDTVHYLWLRPGDHPPNLAFGQFKAVVVIEDTASQSWQEQVSDWLVNSGCLYMMAWGRDCSSWDVSVDVALVNRFNCGEIPDDQFVMTTWHDDEPLSEVFWFSQHCAWGYDDQELKTVLILDIAPAEREAEMKSAYFAPRDIAETDRG